MVSRGISWSRQEIVRGYMVLGGIPQYWGLLDKSMSLSQNIDELFFTENGLMRSEILELHGVSDIRSNDYLSVMERLSQRHGGMTKDEIAKEVKLTGSDDLDKILNDLKLSSFVREVPIFGQGIENPVYQLADFYTLFYFRFIHNCTLIPDFWSHISSYDAWEELAFNNCAWVMSRLLKRLWALMRLPIPRHGPRKGMHAGA